MPVKKRSYYADVKPPTDITCPKCSVGNMLLTFWHLDTGQSRCDNCNYNIVKRRNNGQVDTLGFYSDVFDHKLDVKQEKFDKLDPYGVLEK